MSIDTRSEGFLQRRVMGAGYPHPADVVGPMPPDIQYVVEILEVITDVLATCENDWTPRVPGFQLVGEPVAVSWCIGLVASRPCPRQSWS